MVLGTKDICRGWQAWRRVCRRTKPSWSCLWGWAPLPSPGPSVVTDALSLGNWTLHLACVWILRSVSLPGALDPTPTPFFERWLGPNIEDMFCKYEFFTNGMKVWENSWVFKWSAGLKTKQKMSSVHMMLPITRYFFSRISLLFCIRIKKTENTHFNADLRKIVNVKVNAVLIPLVLLLFDFPSQANADKPIPMATMV